MAGEDWTTIGMPQSVKEEIERRKPEGQPPYIFIQNLLDEVDG
jgi:hypothetical protein